MRQLVLATALSYLAALTACESNSAPTVTALSISPDPAVATDTLECTYIFSDPDKDVDASTLTWLVNSEPQDESGSRLAGVFAKGDSVTCTVTPSDGVTTGIPATVSLVIENIPPLVSDVSISPSETSATTPLTCSYVFSDQDAADTDQSTFGWAINDEEVNDATTSTLESGFVNGDRVTCTNGGSGHDVSLCVLRYDTNSTQPLVVALYNVDSRSGAAFFVRGSLPSSS